MLCLCLDYRLSKRTLLSLTGDHTLVNSYVFAASCSASRSTGRSMISSVRTVLLDSHDLFEYFLFVKLSYCIVSLDFMLHVPARAAVLGH